MIDPEVDIDESLIPICSMSIYEIMEYIAGYRDVTFLAVAVDNQHGNDESVHMFGCDAHMETTLLEALDHLMGYAVDLNNVEDEYEDDEDDISGEEWST